VRDFTDNIYARWRSREVATTVLQEDRESVPPEKLLQSIWQQQRLLRDQLKTLDGQTVRILHPGFGIHSAGPDFRGAIVQIGGGPARTGDIEIDLHSSGWRYHGHDRNPAFNNVVLHVVWETEKAADEKIPVLALSGRLDSSLADLEVALGREPNLALPEPQQGRCCSPLRDLPPEQMQKLLQEAAEVRRRLKADYFLARARQAGWEQSLWEGLFRALGYKQNVWPMHCLAESRGHWQSQRATPFDLQSRMLGISGLLPDQLTRTQTAADGCLRQLWDQWWRERDEFVDHLVPRGAWRFHGLRPANHPQRRLALASHWLSEGNLLARIEAWFTTEAPDSALVDSLTKVLLVKDDDFWSWHLTLRSAKMPTTLGRGGPAGP